MQKGYREIGGRVGGTKTITNGKAEVLIRERERNFSYGLHGTNGFELVS